MCQYCYPACICRPCRSVGPFDTPEAQAAINAAQGLEIAIGFCRICGHAQAVS